MNKLASINPGKPSTFSISESVNVPLMVCTHERSGTHFLMNYLNSCTYYTARPHFDFDYHNFGKLINPFSQIHVTKFFEKISLVSDNNNIKCINSIIKSHFPIDTVKHLASDKIRVIYVYRDPCELFVSYWKYIHSLDWIEGPKLNSPLELARHVPSGYSQRYQTRNFSSYFERWARHVASARQAERVSSAIALVNYQSLIIHPVESIRTVCGRLGVAVVGDPVAPSRDEYVVKGANLVATSEMVEELQHFCKQEVSKFQDLPEDLNDGSVVSGGPATP